MSFRKYPEYKDSGVEWLGKVPGHWDIKPLKYVATYNDEVLSESTPDDYPIKYVEISDVDEQLGITGWSEYTFSSAPSRARRVLKHGDVLISTVRTYLRAVAPVTKPPENLMGSTGFAVIRPVLGVYHSALLGYTLRAEWFISSIIARSVGVSYPAINASDLVALSLPVPPWEEQQTIAAFLDHETARIDALVEEQQRLIELLKEKRQAVISHAVTKGLDPDVPMKDSGVEWLGEVPAHWVVSRLKHVTDRIIDCPHETPVYDPDGDFLVIRTADLEYGVLEPQFMYRLNEGEYNSRTRRSALACGDVVYGREGERWGHAALVPEDNKYCLGQRMMQFIPSDMMCSEFLMWQLNSDNVYRQGDVDVVGATSPHVNVSTIKNYYIAVPPNKEQLAISIFLNKESLAFDELVHSANSLVVLLQERRSVLISAAVTGKIDVRGWQPPAGSSAPSEATQKEAV